MCINSCPSEEVGQRLELAFSPNFDARSSRDDQSGDSDAQTPQAEEENLNPEDCEKQEQLTTKAVDNVDNVVEGSVQSSKAQQGMDASNQSSRLPGQGMTRKRVYRACEVCRRKKVKCNGERPCAHCTAFGENCHYVDTKDRSAYSRRYVEMLEQRLAKMEKTIQEGRFSPRSESNHSAATNAYQERRSEQGSPSGCERTNLPHAYSPERRFKEEMDQDRLSGSSAFSLVTTFPSQCAGRLKVDESRNLRYVGPSSTMTLMMETAEALGNAAGRGIERATAAPANQEMPWLLIPSFRASITSHLPRIEQVCFPDMDLRDTLIRVFFDRIHPIFPVLDEMTFMDTYSQYTSDPQGLVGADIMFLATLFAVFACAARVVRDPRVCPQPVEAREFGYNEAATRGGDANQQQDNDNERPADGPLWTLAGAQYYSKSQFLALYQLNEARLDVVQLHGLLAYYMAASNCSARAWVTTGQAMRLAQDIGIHRNLSHQSLSFEVSEVRKRTWWCIYMLDKLLSVSLGRPCGVEDDNIDAQLPTKEPQPPFPLMPGFIALVALSRTSGRIARTVTRLQQARHQGDVEEEENLKIQARAHEAMLTSWFEALPEHMKDTSQDLGGPLAIQSCIAFCCYQSSLKLLHTSLLHDKEIVAGTSYDQSEESLNLAKCTRTALAVIRMAPYIAKNLPASAYLVEYGQQLLEAGGFLAMNALKRNNCNPFHLLGEADEAATALKLLERSFPGARYLRKALSRMLRMMRERLGHPNRPAKTPQPTVVPQMQIPLFSPGSDPSRSQSGKSRPLQILSNINAYANKSAEAEPALKRRKTVDNHEKPYGIVDFDASSVDGEQGLGRARQAASLSPQYVVTSSGSEYPFSVGNSTSNNRNSLQMTNVPSAAHEQAGLRSGLLKSFNENELGVDGSGNLFSSPGQEANESLTGFNFFSHTYFSNSSDSVATPAGQTGESAGGTEHGRTSSMDGGSVDFSSSFWEFSGSTPTAGIAPAHQQATGQQPPNKDQGRIFSSTTHVRQEGDSSHFGGPGAVYGRSSLMAENQNLASVQST